MQQIRRIQQSRRNQRIRRIRQIALKSFSILLTLLLKVLYLPLNYPLTLLLKVLHLPLNYPLSYTWWMGESQVSTKEMFIPRYLQYGVLVVCVIFLVFNVYVHHYIYTTLLIHRTS